MVNLLVGGTPNGTTKTAFDTDIAVRQLRFFANRLAGIEVDMARLFVVTAFERLGTLDMASLSNRLEFSE